MDKELIKLKGTGDGVKICLSSDAPFANILLALQEKLRAWRKFFGTGHCNMYFTGRELAEYENKKLRDIALFITYLGTGCRVSELVNLDIDDVDFETSSFIVTRKGGDEQEIFMPVQVENELFQYMEERLKNETAKDKKALFLNRSGTRLSPQGVELTLKKYCATIGITDPDKCKPHALRRTFACNMIADGVDIKMVAELMGHKNIEVTHKYYTQYAVEKRREIMRSFDVQGSHR